MHKLILFLLVIVGIACGETTDPLPTLAPSVVAPSPVPTSTSSTYIVIYRVRTSRPSPVDLLYEIGSFHGPGNLPQDYDEDNMTTPWERTFSGVHPQEWLSLIAVAHNDNASVTCEIWVAGELWKSETNSGKTGSGAKLGIGKNYASCSGRLGR